MTYEYHDGPIPDLLSDERGSSLAFLKYLVIICLTTLLGL